MKNPDIDFLNIIKDFSRSLGIKVELSSVEDCVAIDLFLEGGFAQRILIQKTDKFIGFVAPLMPGYDTKGEIPHRLQTALFSRNKPFKFVKWIVDHVERPEMKTQMYCFSCVAFTPLDLDRQEFIEVTQALIDECYWFFNNYEALAMRLHVFLCHASEDRALARDLNNRLQNDGIDIWFDEHKLIPGKEWDLEIVNAVRDSHVVLVLLSNASVTKTGYVQKEIKLALDVADEQPEGGIFLIPVRIDDCRVPTRIRRFQWVDLSQKDGYSKLIQSLSLKAEELGFSLKNNRKNPSANMTAIKPNKDSRMDEHEQYIHEICGQYPDEIINDSICVKIIAHLSVTNRPADATRELIARLPIESRIEIIGNLMLAREMRLSTHGQPLRNLEICLNTLQSLDRASGKFLKYPLSSDEHNEIIKLIVEDMQQTQNLRDERVKLPSYAEVSRHHERLKEKNVFSYRTLLEVVIRQKRVQYLRDIDSIHVHNQVKTYIQYQLYISGVLKSPPRST